MKRRMGMVLAIAVAPASHDILAKFMAELGLSDMIKQPGYDSHEGRRAHREELNAAVNERMAEADVDHWVDRLNAAGVPAGKVLTPPAVLADPQIAAQEMVIDVDHGPHGILRMVGFPVKLSATPAAVRRPAPDLGQHTQEVLAELGLDEQEIAALRTGNVLR